MSLFRRVYITRRNGIKQPQRCKSFCANIENQNADGKIQGGYESNEKSSKIRRQLPCQRRTVLEGRQYHQSR